VIVTLSMANTIMSVPCAYRLYLPEVWMQDRKRCREAGIPDEVLFAAKWEIALAEIDDLLAEDLPRAPVSADAGYGMVTAFREGLTRRRLSYAVAIPSETTVWPPGSQPLAQKRWSGRGRHAIRVRRTPRHRPLSARELAQRLPLSSWKGEPKGGAESAAVPKDSQQMNLTDPDSALMRKSRRDSYEQAYNAQAVVDVEGSQMILATDVIRTPSDANQLEPALKGVTEAVGPVQRMLADGGM